jgi:O-antigen/teichoic acid export membrane protein
MMSRLASLLKNAAARNASWMFLGQILSVVMQAGYFVILARLLGSKEYGLFAGAFALVSIVSQFSTVGSGVIFLRYVSPDHSKASVYWGNILASTLTLGTLLVVALHYIGDHFIGEKAAGIVTFIAVSECLFRRLTDCCGQVFQAFEKLRLTACISLITSCLRLLLAGGMFLMLHSATARQWAIASLVVSFVAVCIAVCVVTMRVGRPQLRTKVLFSHTLEGFGFSLATSTGSVYNDVDKAMLGHYGMTVANGIYTMAYRVVDIATIPIFAVHSAVLPRFFRLSQDGISATGRFGGKVLSRTILLGLVAAACMFVGAPIIPYIVGKSFSQSVSALRWLCLLPIFRSLHLSAGDALLAGGYQKVRFTLQSMAACANVVLNLYWIPKYSWTGAAWSSLLTDGVLGILSWVVLSELMRRKATSGVSMSMGQHADERAVA